MKSHFYTRFTPFRPKLGLTSLLVISIAVLLTLAPSIQTTTVHAQAPSPADETGDVHAAAIAADTALEFDGSTNFVTFGAAPNLGLSTFTIEAWFNWAGGGDTVSTGTGGIVGVPLVTKGRGEGDGANVDMNYFLGISGGKLAADFEEGAAGSSPGLNHPVTGDTTVTTNVWHHVAVTYDGTCWQLYLDGNPDTDGTNCPAEPPRSDSIQHAGIATAMKSTGIDSDDGKFEGVIDEVRIWNIARTQSEIRSTISAELTSGTGLVGRWGMEEGSGTTIADSTATAADGTLIDSPSWVTPGAPFDIVFDTVPPAAPVGLAATPVSGGVSLAWTANSESDLAGYNVYRSESASVPLTSPLNGGTPVSGVSYVDGGLINGTDYYYVVTAVDSSDNESPASNEVTATPPASTGSAVDFDSANDCYITLGNPPKLGLAQFTLETWFKREGPGVSHTTGGGGINAIPLISKGAAESENSNVDMNYLLGIGDSNVLVADFEEGAGGSDPSQNHPLSGITPILNDVWYHAAVTYDGTTLRLFLDGSLEAELSIGEPAASATTSPTALGTSLRSNGTTALGFFDGVMDEVRIWNVARTQAQIQGAINAELTSGTGLVGRWGMNEGSGTTIADPIAPVGVGTLTNGPTWVTPGAPFNYLPGDTKTTFHDGVDSYTGTRDTYIWQTDPGTPRGSETTFVQDINTGNERRSLLLFDLSSIPADAIIASAQLQFYVDQEGQGFNMYRMLTSWDEATITYNSIGGRHFAADGTDAESSVNANWPGDDGIAGTITVVVPTSTIQDWINGTLANNGWLMIATHGSDGQQLRSREHGTIGDRPKLTVEYTGGTLSVSVSYFLAEPDGESVKFTWQTSTETGNAGFNLLAKTDDGLTQLNDELIASTVIDSVEPTDYHYEAVTPATLFYIEEVSISGGSKRFGPFALGKSNGAYVNIDGGSAPAIWLPMIRN